MKAIINNKITLSDVPQGLMAEIKNRLSFVNPKWEVNEKKGYWNGETPRVLKFYEVADEGSLVIPRGFMRQLIRLCRHEDLTFHIEDARRVLPDVSFSVEGKHLTIGIVSSVYMVAEKVSKSIFLNPF